LSLWEVFTLFDQLNTKHAQMFFEPQRYHHIMFGSFYTFIKNQAYNRTVAAKPTKKGRAASKEAKPSARSPAKQKVAARPTTFAEPSEDEVQ